MTKHGRTGLSLCIATITLLGCTTADRSRLTLFDIERRLVSVDLGTNENDEYCTPRLFVPNPSDFNANSTDVGLTPDMLIGGVEIQCGTWEAPAATLLAIDVTHGADAVTLEEAASHRGLVVGDGQRALIHGLFDYPSETTAEVGCVPDPTSDNGRRDALWQCRRLVGYATLPLFGRASQDKTVPLEYSAISGVDGGVLFLAHGLRSAMPAMTRLVDGLLGAETSVDAGSEPTVAARLRREQYGVGLARDLQYEDFLQIAEFDAIMKRGQGFANLRDFRRSSQSFRLAIAELDRLQDGIESALGQDGLSPAERRRLVGQLDNLNLLRGNAFAQFGLQSSNLGLYGQADEAFREAQKRLLGVRGSLNPLDTAMFWSYQAIDFGNQGRYGEGLAEIEAATKLRLQELEALADTRSCSALETLADRRVGEETRSPAEMRAIADLAQGYYLASAFHYLNRKPDDAAKEALAGLCYARLLEAGNTGQWVPEIGALLAEIAIDDERFAEAEGLLEEAVAAEAARTPDSRLHGLLLMRLATIQYWHLDKADSGLASFEAAETILRQRAASIGGQHALYQPDDILPYVLALLQEADANRADGISPAPPTGERDRLYRRAFYAAQLIGTGDSGESLFRTAIRFTNVDTEDRSAFRQWQIAGDLRTKPGRADPSDSFDQLDLIIQARFGADFSERRSADGVATDFNRAAADFLESLRQVPERESIVQIVTGRQLYDGAIGATFAVRGGDMAVHRIRERASDLTNSAIQLRKAFEIEYSAEDSKKPDIRQDAIAGGNFFYQIFIGDAIGAFISGSDHVHFVPTREWFSFPFSALHLGPDEPNDWFIRRHALSVSSSIDGLLTLRRAEGSQASRPVISLGKSDFSQWVTLELVSDSLNPSRCSALLPSGLSQLDYTEEEGDLIVRALSGDSGDFFGGGKANKAMLQRNLSDYRILHFATHGYLPNQKTRDCWPDPALVVTPGFEPTGFESSYSGFISSVEISALELDAELVVLSACETGSNLLQSDSEGEVTSATLVDQGESVNELARSFQAAGARAVLATYWAVNDLTSRDLMVDLLTGSQIRESSISQALRLLQLQLMDSDVANEPYIWSAYFIIGDGTKPALSNYEN